MDLRARLPLLIALAIAAPAAAQESDPIAALLAGQAPSEEEAELGAPTPTPAPYTPPVTSLPPVNHAPAASVTLPAYTPPPPSAPTWPTRTTPVHVDDVGATPEPPLNSTELGYEQRIRSSFASAQGLQGPLDGAWTLRSSRGAPLYGLLLVDNGVSPLEGAWRDPRRKGAADASGFMAAIGRNGSELIATFYPRPGVGAVNLVLQPTADGAWTGQLSEDGSTQSVTLRRD